MTLKTFFTGRATGFGLLFLIGLGVFMYRTYFPVLKNTEVADVSIQENNQPPVFVWKYEKAQSLNLDGLPETNVFVEATYPNGAVQKKLVTTAAGGCNDLPDAEKDSATGSKNAQCYSAGLGYRFKIIKGDRTYLVQRKTFEEALPGHMPPEYTYQTVAEFPFYN